MIGAAFLHREGIGFPTELKAIPLHGNDERKWPVSSLRSPFFVELTM